MLTQVAVQMVAPGMDLGPVLARAPIDAFLKSCASVRSPRHFATDVDCNCHHEGGHDSRGCLEIDEATGEYCLCNHAAGAVECGDRESAQNRVGQRYTAMLGADLAELARDTEGMSS